MDPVEIFGTSLVLFALLMICCTRSEYPYICIPCYKYMVRRRNEINIAAIAPNHEFQNL